MKKYVLVLSLFCWSSWSMAQDQVQGGSTCDSLVSKTDEDLKKNPDLIKRRDNCIKMEVAARANGYSVGAKENKSSFDKKINCVLVRGYTLDYQDCKDAMSAYNAIIVAEKAMFSQQAVRQELQQQDLQKEAAEQAAQGNMQGAAIDVAKKTNEQLSKMYQEQAYTYSGAVMALGGSLASWKGKKKKAAERICKKAPKKEEKAGEALTKEGIAKTDCVSSVSWVADNLRNEAFANDGVRGELLKLSAEYMIKAAEANRRAGITDDTAQKLAQIPTDELDEDALFEKCQLMPNDPACSSNNRVETGTFEGSTISFGEGGNNAINMGDKPSGDSSADLATPISGEPRVSDVSNSFQDEARKASGILDPAGKANFSVGSSNPGGSAGGGGGGGGVGGGGGGGGSSEPKEEGDGEPVVNVKDHKGNFEASGGGFAAVKGSGGDDANPYASLFDSKGEAGGIEEDRSIASESGGPSALFERISKRYGQAYGDKRIEANNLE